MKNMVRFRLAGVTRALFFLLVTAPGSCRSAELPLLLDFEAFARSETIAYAPACDLLEGCNDHHDGHTASSSDPKNPASSFRPTDVSSLLPWKWSTDDGKALGNNILGSLKSVLAPSVQGLHLARADLLRAARVSLAEDWSLVGGLSGGKGRKTGRKHGNRPKVDVTITLDMIKYNPAGTFGSETDNEETHSSNTMEVAEIPSVLSVQVAPDSENGYMLHASPSGVAHTPEDAFAAAIEVWATLFYLIHFIGTALRN